MPGNFSKLGYPQFLRIKSYDYNQGRSGRNGLEHEMGYLHSHSMGVSSAGFKAR